MFDIFTNAMSGGVFGLLGAIGTSVTNIIKRRGEINHEQNKWIHEIKLLELQSERQNADHANESALLASNAAWNGLQTAIKAERSIQPNLPWVQAIRSLWRPILTGFLLILVCVLWKDLWSHTKVWEQFLSPKEFQNLIKYIVNAVVFSASAAILFWFGERGLRPDSKNHNG